MPCCSRLSPAHRCCTVGQLQKCLHAEAASSLSWVTQQCCSTTALQQDSWCLHREGCAVSVLKAAAVRKDNCLSLRVCHTASACGNKNVTSGAALADAARIFEWPTKQGLKVDCPHEESAASAEAAALHPLQATTPIMLGATAGLRLLPEGKADKILDAVRKWLGQFAFNLDKKSGVTILDGAIASH